VSGGSIVAFSRPHAENLSGLYPIASDWGNKWASGAMRRDGRMPEAKSSFHRLLGPGFPTRNVAKGKTIFQEGDHGDEFFVVVRGRVEIRSGDRHFETLDADGIFGEMALIDDNPRSATAVALTDVTLAPIKENQFLFLVQNTPFFALSVMRVLARRLRRQNKAA
jgi:CRP/FNR family transcriptional regulator, cyclic AMP receptor protein